MAIGIIFDIKEFTVHDGPGIRITVFFKGCPLRCAWCHNPEGLDFAPELMVRRSFCRNCGKCRRGCAHEECRPFGVCTKVCPEGAIGIVGRTANSRDLAAELKKQEDFLAKTNGGITLSGGEPLAQPEFLIALLAELKPLHTAVETSGYGDKNVFAQVIAAADLIMFDVKHMDREMHKRITGSDNALILENLDRLIDSGKRFVARVPLIPGINDGKENLEQIALYLEGAAGLQRVELLPYNPFAGAKYPMVNREYKPAFDEKREARVSIDVFDRHGIKCIMM